MNFLVEGIWSIVTETGGEKGGQPLSDIVVVFSGSEGESSPLLLLSHQDKPFQIGQTDTCQVSTKFTVKPKFSNSRFY